jgi:tetratricopeptide (TPR) repeat protein
MGLLRPATGLAGVALFIAACASPGALLPRLEKLEAGGNFDQAAAMVDGAKDKDYGEKNALLFYLDRATLLQLAGKYQESAATFEKAKALSKELFTKSVTVEAGTFLVSDNIRPYAGENFERAQIPLFNALNYVGMGQGAEALVETRQVDALLTKLKTDLGTKDIYTEDAFARYLAGLIQEDQGETNDAFISYYQALKAYDTYLKQYGVSAPPELAEDALRTAQALGFRDRVDEIGKRWGGQAPSPRPKDAGEVVVIHYQGLAPRKVDNFFEIGAVNGWPYVEAQRTSSRDAAQVEEARTIFRSVVADQMIRVTFPSYQAAPYKVRGMTVRAEGAQTEHAAAVAQDIGAIAAKNLQDRIGRERAKAIARAVVKWSLTQKVAAKVKEKRGDGAAFLVKTLLQVASSSTEVADKRSWGTLPDKIAVARVVLPEGPRTLHLTFRDASGGAAGTRDLKDVAVRAGRRTFVIVRTAD